MAEDVEVDGPADAQAMLQAQLRMLTQSVRQQGLTILQLCHRKAAPGSLTARLTESLL